MDRELTPIEEERGAANVLTEPALLPVSGWQWATAAVFLGAAALILASVSWRAYIYAPFSDAFDWALQVFDSERSGDWVHYAWAPHTGQRIPLARIAEALDIEWLKGRAPTFLLAGAAAFSTGAAALVLLVWRAPIPQAVKLCIATLAGLVLLNIAVGEDLAIPIFAVYLFVTGPALAAIALFHVDPAAGLRSHWFWLAIVFAVLASCGNAAGFVIWPALLVCAWRQERAGRPLQVILFAGVLCVAALEVGLSASAGSSSSPSDASSHLIKMVRYFASFSGLPWSRGVRPALVGELFGCLVDVAAVILLVRRGDDAADRYAGLTGAGKGLIVFGLLAALLASIGRVDEFPLPLAATRYAPFALLLQTGIVLRCARWFEPMLASGPKRTATGITALSVALLAAQLHGAAFLLRTAAQIRASGADLDAGRPTTGIPVYPDLAKARRVRSQFKERGLPY